MTSKLSIVFNNIKILFFYTKYIYILLILSFISAILETLGFISILPLITLTTENNSSNFIFDLFNDFFDYFHIKFNQKNIIILIVILFSIKGFLIFIQKYYSSSIIVSLRLNLRADILNRINNIKFEYFNSAKKNLFSNAVITEVARFVSGINNLVKLLFIIISIAVYLPTTFILDFQLSIFLYSTSIFFIILLIYVTKRTRRYSVNITHQNEIIQSLVLNYVNFLGYFKSTNIISLINNRILKSNSKLLENEKKIIFNSVFLDSVKEPIAIILILSLFFYKINILNSDLATFAVYIIIIYRLLIQTLSIPNYFQKIMSMSGGVETIEKIKKIVKENNEKKYDRTNYDFKNFNEIVFDNVNFSLGNNKILENITFKINKNEKLFIFGKSGSGKSTIIKLILNLFNDYNGNIFLNDKNTKKINLDKLRKKIGYIPQDPLIFNDTSWNNITLWDIYNDKNKIKFEKIINELNIDFINLSKDDHLSKYLGDQGSKLSGGQKQKIVIARELYKMPELLIFDEATVNLDKVNEKYIYKYIDSLDMTKIIVTHDSSMMDNKSKVLFIEDGKILYHGNFKDALLNEHFSKVYNYQRELND